MVSSRSYSRVSTHPQPSLLLAELLPPLYARYLEFNRCDRILIDHKAAQALAEIIVQTGTVTPPHRVAQLSSVIRSRYFDLQIATFLERHPQGLVVNLGVGLCTRFWRLPMVPRNWYEVDSPEVMDLRRTYLTIAPREQDISKPGWDCAWMQEIECYAHQPVLVVLEGAAMYWSPPQNQALFKALVERFKSLEVLIDTIHPRYQISEEELLGAIPSRQAEQNFSLDQGYRSIQWGLANISEIQGWGVNCEVLRDWPYLMAMADYPSRLEGWMTEFLPILYPLLQDSARVYHLRLRG
jgi:O-methyltransferase involved in polyketide biosynthesis